MGFRVWINLNKLPFLNPKPIKYRIRYSPLKAVLLATKAQVCVMRVRMLPHTHVLKAALLATKAQACVIRVRMLPGSIRTRMLPTHAMPCSLRYGCFFFFKQIPTDRKVCCPHMHTFAYSVLYLSVHASYVCVCYLNTCAHAYSVLYICLYMHRYV